MQEQLETIKRDGLTALEPIDDSDALENWRVAHLGRSSPLMDVFNQLGQLPKEERPAIGRSANQVKKSLEASYAEKVEYLKEEELKRTLSTEHIDVTLPGRKVQIGRLHPITQTMRRIYQIFAEMGFQVYQSRDVETDEYNFQLLNFPPHHPAREMQDSYYVAGEFEEDNPVLLRTHTSPGQIHAMREYAAENPDDPPPIRIILPGMCYRHEQLSTRSETQFTQSSRQIHKKRTCHTAIITPTVSMTKLHPSRSPGTFPSTTIANKQVTTGILLRIT